MVEAHAIRDTLGDAAVTAPKSYFGNLGPGGGAVEMVASVQALKTGSVPPTLNYETPDANCPINVVAGQPLTDASPAAVVMNQASTGQAVSVVLSN